MHAALVVEEGAFGPAGTARTGRLVSVLVQRAPDVSAS
jgi:hypothetical protein